MKYTLLVLIFGCSIYGCKNEGLPDKYLSNISVVRETENVQASPYSPPSVPSKEEPHSSARYSNQARYHIIVGSFSASEKARAEQLVEKLKAQDYPATLIISSQRFRVSIESFPTESEANEARDEYRKITDRQDIWVHKVE